MTINETREVIVPFIQNDPSLLAHRHNRALVYEGASYQIRPDDAFYFPGRVLLVEYENTARPVESISKYFWLFKNTNWLGTNLKINLLLTINRGDINTIRTETIPILGSDLKAKYPSNFDFYFLNYNDLNKEAIIAVLQNMTSINYP